MNITLQRRDGSVVKYPGIGALSVDTSLQPTTKGTLVLIEKGMQIMHREPQWDRLLITRGE